jgi:hypothetical protein
MQAIWEKGVVYKTKKTVVYTTELYIYNLTTIWMLHRKETDI